MTYLELILYLQAEMAKCEQTALAQPEQEPVAFYHPRNGFYWAKPTSIFAPTVVDAPPMPLYTAPPQRPWVGLTEDEIASTATSVNIEFDDDFSLSDQTIYYVDAASLIGFTRAIEAKLKERNK